MIRRPPRSTLFPTRRSSDLIPEATRARIVRIADRLGYRPDPLLAAFNFHRLKIERDRKSTRLNSSHQIISYAVFCLKKKKTTDTSRSLLASSQLGSTRQALA